MLDITCVTAYLDAISISLWFEEAPSERMRLKVTTGPFGRPWRLYSATAGWPFEWLLSFSHPEKLRSARKNHTLLQQLAIPYTFRFYTYTDTQIWHMSAPHHLAPEHQLAQQPMQLALQAARVPLNGAHAAHELQGFESVPQGGDAQERHGTVLEALGRAALEDPQVFGRRAAGARDGDLSRHQGRGSSRV